MHNNPENFGPDINPATGLPMLENTWLDVGGSPYAVDVYQPHYEPQPAYEPFWPPVDCWDAW